jgi:hypothetical protein
MGASLVSRTATGWSAGGGLGVTVLGWSSVMAWILGYLTGDVNYQYNMQPWYAIKELNSYPSVDPGKFMGNSFMDGGRFEFTVGSRIWREKSTGFKDGNVYCVAPIVNGSNARQNVFDFWAVGINCCSGHLPDFHCGEYLNPNARKGLRVLNVEDQDMFRLVIKKAEAEFQLHAPHPVFLYWLADPVAEENAWRVDGYNAFTWSVVGYFCMQILVVILALIVHLHGRAMYKFLRDTSWGIFFG